MFRAVLIHYLTLAVAIAPSICCCNSAALFGQAVRTIFPFSSSEVSQSSNTFQCPFHAALGVSKDSAAGDVDPSSHEEGTPAEHHCPCHKLKPAMALSSVKSSVDITKLVELCDLVCLPTASVDVLSYTTANIDFSNHAASPIGRDILRAYQHFRC